MLKSTKALVLLVAAISTSSVFAQGDGDAAADPLRAAAAPEGADEAADPRSQDLEARSVELERQIRALQEQMAVALRRFAELRSPSPFSNAAELSDLLRAVGNVNEPGAEIEATERKLRELEVEREQLRRRYSESHPQMKLLEQQIAALRERLTVLRAAEATNRSATEAENRLKVEATRAALDRALREARLARDVDAAVRAAEEEERRAATEVQAAVRSQRSEAALRAERRALEPEDLIEFAILGNTLRYSTTVWDTIQLISLTPQLGEYFGTQNGILVLRAPDPSLGLRDGDVILDIGGRAPTSPEHTLRILSSYDPGETLRLAILRNGRPQTHEIVLPQADSDASATHEAPAPSLAQPPQRPQQRQPAQEGGFPGGGAIR